MGRWRIKEEFYSKIGHSTFLWKLRVQNMLLHCWPSHASHAAMVKKAIICNSGVTKGTEIFLYLLLVLFRFLSWTHCMICNRLRQFKSGQIQLCQTYFAMQCTGGARNCCYFYFVAVTAWMGQILPESTVNTWCVMWTEEICGIDQAVTTRYVLWYVPCLYRFRYNWYKQGKCHEKASNDQRHVTLFCFDVAF